MKFVMRHKATGEVSVTQTAFVYGFATCLIKLILSGITIGKLHLTVFSGVDFAAAVGALGAVYVMNKRGKSR